MASDFGPSDSLAPSLLARYLSGEADRDEQARVERWIATSPDNRAIVHMMRAVWNCPSGSTFDPDDTVWQRLQANIAAPRPGLAAVDVHTDNARSFGPGARRRRWFVAAAFGALAAGAALAVHSTDRDRRPSPDSKAAVARSAAPEFVTRAGQRLALRLADGTRVMLGPESRLRIAKGGADSQRSREAWLDEGEALFTVVHDSRRPFRVHTATGVAEDLGTEFVVTNYPETRGTRVVVTSGVVELRRAVGDPASAAVTLEAGDLGTVSAGGAVARERGVDVRPYVSWADGTLTFDGTPLRDAIAALRRWYDAEIELGRPELADMKVTATFRDETAAQALALIAMSLELTVAPRGDAMILR